MHIFWLPLVAVLLIGAGIDYYIFREMKKCERLAGAMSRLHIVLASVVTVAMIVAAILPLRSPAISNGTMVAAMWLMMIYFMMYVPKMLWAICYQPSRLKCLKLTGRRVAKGCALAVALLALSVLWKAVKVTPFQPQVVNVDITCEGLPKSFDNYKIVHISDTHLGTFQQDTSLMAQCADIINSLDADVICFTGDLVSRTASEAEPFANILERMHSKDGVLAVLGNHDYDDYTDMTPEQRDIDHNQLLGIQEEAGWLVLNNSSTKITRGGDTIAVAGTENYNAHRLPDYSNLQAALSEIPHGRFTILLQHNPEMWEPQVAGKAPVGLTLSGHTHAFQMIFQLGPWRFSPAQFRYKQWGGLYTQGQQHIYVNTGIGMIGVPMRLGAPPEITVITLRSQ